MDFRRPLEAVTPTLDGDVLRVLARADTDMTGRQIQRLTGHGSHQGIRNAADRLTQQGVVARRSVGNAHLYRLNREHVAAHWIEGLASLPEQIVERLRNLVETWAQPPLLAMLFGSVATGQATPDSDLDLLIVRPGGCDPDAPAWREQIATLEANATAWTGNDARVMEYGEDELKRGKIKPLLQDALRDGIELHGSPRPLRRRERAGSPR
jgi:predicted nucleotidyltransferase